MIDSLPVAFEIVKSMQPGRTGGGGNENAGLMKTDIT